MSSSVFHAAASAVAAALLFAIQPWAAKSLLPHFGGSASVWLTSLLFFQTAVVAGYLYAHVAAKLPRFVHIVLLALVAVALPFAVEPRTLGVPVAEVLVSLAAGLGVVTLLISATTPLLHSWLARDADDDEPYSLYAASNIGSFAGLFAYPLLIEPFSSLHAQANVWKALLVIAAVFVTITAWTTRDRVYRPARGLTASSSKRRSWFVLAFVPTSLLYGFTAFATRDIAALPLIWVIPLALYLLTFALAFARRPVRMPAAFTWAGPVILYFTAMATAIGTASLVTLVLHLVAFTTFALYFHGRLSDERPGSEQATSFYLWVSLGGVAAGIFNAILAPMLFDGPGEYALTYGLALVLMPAGFGAFEGWTRRLLYVLMACALAVGFAIAPGAWMPKLAAAGVMWFAFFVALNMPALTNVMLAVFLGAVVTYPGDVRFIEQRRSFYGTHSVEVRTVDGVEYVALTVGITQHGRERLEGDLEPLGYYHRQGPCGQVMEDVARTKPAIRVALIGLGVGSMAQYARETDQFRFFELDPAVVDLAQSHFRSLPTALGDVTVVINDGRLGLAQSEERFDLIVVDAFSSDAIPSHLLTVEAFKLYEAHLGPGGRVLLHTSNRYLDVDRVAVGTLSSLGWTHRQQHWDLGKAMPSGAWPSSWVVAAPPTSSLGALASDAAWQSLKSDLVWTDSYSSLVRALR